MESEGNLAVIDDDQLPSGVIIAEIFAEMRSEVLFLMATCHAPPRVTFPPRVTQLPPGPIGGAWSGRLPHASSGAELFPALPEPAPPRAPVEARCHHCAIT